MVGKFLAVLCLSLVCKQIQSQHVYRRSDDPNTLETLVQQQASTIQSMQAQLDALQNDVTAIKEKTGVYVESQFTLRWSFFLFPNEKINMLEI